MAPSTPELLTTLLREVSRSFYLTMRVLPGAIRPQIGLAYLLARTADTIADTELVPLTQRLDALRSLRERSTTHPPSARHDHQRPGTGPATLRRSRPAGHCAPDRRGTG